MVLLDSIRSAQHVLEGSYYTDYIATKRKLENLELFVLCTRKLGNNAQVRFDDGKVSSTLASLFQRILDALSRRSPYNTFEKIIDLRDAIGNFNEEIGGWYNALLNSQLPQPTFDEVTEIVDSLLEHLVLLFTKATPHPDRLSMQPIEDLIEKITFLRNFSRFVTLRSVEPPQLNKFLVHIHLAAVDAAHTSFMYICLYPKYDVEPNVPVLLQKIKMVDPQVDETYTQALTSSKLSTLSPMPDNGHDPLVVMKDFIDSLLSNLWERMHTDTKSELQLVEEGLRLLSIMLQAQPNIFDNNFEELTRVICDAGILIFSRDMEIAVPTLGLRESISCFRRLSDINMMAPLLLNSIRSALNTTLRPPTLKNLEVLVKCARKLGNDAQLRFDDGKVITLTSLFQRIQLALSRYPPPYSDFLRMPYLHPAIDNFSEEIRTWLKRGASSTSSSSRYCIGRLFSCSFSPRTRRCASEGGC